MKEYSKNTLKSRKILTIHINQVIYAINYFRDINETTIENSLFTNQSFKLDLMIRTSGEVRLSDFLLWQSNMSTLAFDKKTWPEFTIWNFYSCILKFQLNYKNIQVKNFKINFIN